jgi:hypothetical protein
VGKYKNINTHIENPQYTRHKRSKIKGDKDTKYKNINTHIGNPLSTRHKRSKIKDDLDTKYKNINTYRGIHSPQDTRVLK